MKKYFKRYFVVLVCLGLLMFVCTIVGVVFAIRWLLAYA